MKRWPDQYTGKPRELKVTGVKYQSELEGSHSGLGGDCKGLVRIFHPSKGGLDEAD